MPDTPITKNNIITTPGMALLACLLTLLVFCFLSSYGMANDLKRDLQRLQNQLQRTQSQNKNIQDKLEKTIQEQSDLQDVIDQQKYKTAQLIHYLNALKNKSSDIGFLSPHYNHNEYQIHLRTIENIQNVIEIQLSDTKTKQNNLADIEKSIADYMHKRDILDKTINEYFTAIENIQNDKHIIAQYKPLIDHLKSDISTLGELMQALNLPNDVASPPHKPNNDKQLAFQLPVSGIIADDGHGITITTSDKSLVHAPERGVIAYADYFRNIGNVIIIHHGDGYVSAIKGINKIYVRPGAEITKGEPLGILSLENHHKDKINPILYFELRYNGQYTHPMDYLTGL